MAGRVSKDSPPDFDQLKAIVKEENKTIHADFLGRKYVIYKKKEYKSFI